MKKFNIKNNIANILLVIAGLVLALTPFVLFPVCQVRMANGKPMMCYYSGIFITIVGAVIILLALINLFVKKKWIWNITYILIIIGGIVSYMVPEGIIKIGDKASLGWQCGLCMKDHAGMTCNSLTMPAIRILVPIIVILGLIGLFINFTRKEK